MANLLAHDAKGVERRIQAADNLAGRKLTAENDELKKGLQDMINAVRADEQAFYSKIGVRDYKEFTHKLQGLNIRELDFLLARGSIVTHYINNYTFPRTVSQDEAISYLTRLIELNLDKIGIDIEEEILDETKRDITEKSLDYIKQAFTGKKGYLRYFASKQSGKRIGVGKLQFSLSKIEQNNTPKLQVEAQILEASQPIGQTLLKKIIDRLNDDGKQDAAAVFTKAEFKENVIKMIRTTAKGTSWSNTINYVLSNRTNEIDITRSYAGLVGFLGEVRAIAILHRLFGKGVRGTGALREAATRKEIAIDTLVRQGLDYFGFQIKNYTLNDGKVTFTSSMSSLNFIQNRLCLSGTVADIISDIFGVYQFNQPFKDEALVNYFENTNYPVSKYENEVYSKVPTVLAKLQPIFESRLGHVLRVGRDFSVDGHAIFGEPKMYYNSFFFIEGEYIPSSVILEGLLEQLDSGVLQNYANISYSFTNSPDATLENYYNKLPSKAFALEKQRIHYNVTLDVRALVQRALNEI